MSGLEMTMRVRVRRRLSRKHVMNKPQKIFMTKAVLVVEGEIKKRWPKGSPGTSTSFRSIEHQVDRRKPPRWGKVRSTSGYGRFVEEGRRPGKMPPMRAIAPWVRRAGMPRSATFLVARSIGRHGTKGHWAMRDGGKAARKAVRKLLGKQVRTSVRGWRGRAPRG